MAGSLSKRTLLPWLKDFRQHVLRNRHDRGESVKIGVCVSGGPDSMALAHLLNRLDTDDLGFQVQPVALIVDHNARPGSDLEASNVREALSRFGLAARIEKLQWPQASPSEINNFEGQARTLRYDVLTKAAIDLGIRYLFLGHHRDDQVETALMRLIRDNNPSYLGLQGMADYAGSFASAAVYGAKNEAVAGLPRSFGYRTTRLPLAEVVRKQASNRDDPPYINNNFGRMVLLRPGGVQLFRPFLGVPKSALVAYCQAQSVPFVIDKTNNDPTFTTRNAVRVLREQKLPRALQDPSMLRLIDSAKRQKALLNERITRYLKRVSILTLDLMGGVALVRLPDDFATWMQDAELVARGVLTQLCRLISPIPEESVKTLAPVGPFRQLQAMLSNRPQDGASLHAKAPSAVQCLSTQIERVESVHSMPGRMVWRLTRPSMRPEHRDACDLVLEADPLHDNATEYVSTKWVLYDYRYWVRVITLPQLIPLLHIRPFDQRDWPSLTANLSHRTLKKLRNMLDDHAPGLVRYTLPVLVCRDQVVAFLTIDDKLLEDNLIKAVTSEGSMGRRDGNIQKVPTISWQVVYKIIPNMSASGSQPLDNSPASTMVPG